MTTYVSLPVDNQPQYGSFLFAEYLEQRFGSHVIAETWQAQADQKLRAIDAIAYVLDHEHSTTLAEVVLDYHRANDAINGSSSEVGSARTYNDYDRDTWISLLTATGGRPAHTPTNVRPGTVVHGSGVVEAGGAFYLDLHDAFYTAPDYQLLDAAGVTFTVSVDATGGDTTDLTAQVAYFDAYPSICYPYDTRELDTSPGHAEQTITLSPSCPMASLIVSNPQAQNARLWNRGEIDFTYTITAQPSSTATVTEHRRFGEIHQRVNLGNDLRRWLAPAAGTATISVDLDRSVSQGRRYFNLSVYSYDSKSRTSDTLIINGTPLEATVRRSASVSDGRYALLYGNKWSTYALTSYTIPTGLLHDGGNDIQIPIKGSTYIVGAYITSSDPTP